MALSPRLNLRQTQAPVMTPQLQQAIKLLQLSNLELAAFVESELEQNPLLEREDVSGEGEDFAGEDGGAAETAAETGPETESDEFGEGPETPDVGELTQREAASETDAPLDTDYENVWADDFQPAAASADTLSPASESAFSASGSGGQGFDMPDPGDLAAERTPTLREHLSEQLNVDIADQRERLIGRTLIESLNENGYLATTLEAIADQLGCSLAEVETVFMTLRRFDPIGVFARDLADCFALQLAERDRLDPAMQAFLDNLDLMAQHDIAALQTACGVDREDIADIIAELKTLDPKPGAAFNQELTQWVAPDVFLRAKPKGGWIIELNSDTLPRVLVNRHYYAEISAKKLSDKDKHYMQESLQTANWLVKALDQRANTILKVATEIVRQQDAFFQKGVAHLVPLVLNDIAQAVEMHESTVSRVTANKYIMTPRGLFELKYFFTTAIGATEAGQSHSAESVRHQIKELIAAESVKNVLSDDRIVQILRSDGVEIARRTVAKYRDVLHIPSSVQRRRMKRAHAPL
jgi:RNA polymerase sigma-54 factor